MKQLALTALTLATAGTLQAQDVKINGLVQVWGVQMLDSNLRTNSAAPGGYYNLRSDFKENGFTVRRTELKLSGKILDNVSWEVMIDPTINTSTSNPTILQDAALVYKTGVGLDVKVGQFKTGQGYEGLTPSSETLFAERGQMVRMFQDKRDRGVMASYGFGDKAFGGKVSFGLFNGMSDATSGKSSDTNSQKDVVARLEFNAGSAHKFGAYTLQGSTDLSDKSGLNASNNNAWVNARPFAGGANAPTAAQVIDNKDKTTNLGAFYVFQQGAWQGSAEVMTGLLGRRFPSLYNTPLANTDNGNAKRQHLDQKYQGVMLTGAYTAGAHTFLVRYDHLNLNSGNDWYTAYNPYTTNANGPILVNGGRVNYAPKFTEITAGYTYAFKPELVKAANVKLNYIRRSKNFLAPAANQTGEQGGDTLLVALQVAF